MTGAILPSLLHQAPRYYQLGHGTFKHRLGYAISRIFVSRSDSGNTVFNASEGLGGAVAAGIANTYHPAGDRTVANTHECLVDRGWLGYGGDWSEGVLAGYPPQDAKAAPTGYRLGSHLFRGQFWK
jgi:hypothetical protein